MAVIVDEGVPIVTVRGCKGVRLALKPGIEPEEASDEDDMEFGIPREVVAADGFTISLFPSSMKVKADK